MRSSLALTAAASIGVIASLVKLQTLRRRSAAYLEDTLTKIVNGHLNTEIHEFLPWSYAAPTRSRRGLRTALCLMLSQNANNLLFRKPCTLHPSVFVRRDSIRGEFCSSRSVDGAHTVPPAPAALPKVEGYPEK